MEFEDFERSNAILATLDADGVAAVIPPKRALELVVL
jgi:hypothetical protein